ncbi:P-loop containing nucleoside triphosphate hydrolase [Phytophthora cactorum]|nr:P-loop containing nucleoside triphosphate hydrolase [Phytophthora cactorum]
MKQRAGDAITEVELVIIDEVSMMKKYQLSQLDTRLQLQHVCLMGRSVVSILFLSETFCNYQSHCTQIQRDVAELEGYNLWQQFLDVIMLKENVQF